MRKIEKVVISIPVILILLLILTEIGVMIANNYVALQTKNDIVKISLPEKTEMIETISGAKKYNGNGNGIQYFGAILVKSELSLEELDKYYSEYREYGWDYIVDEQQGSEIRITNNQLAFETEPEEDGYYIIYSWGNTDCDFIEQYDWRGR